MAIGLGIAALIGYGLGVMYFGGLWWTVNSLPKSRNPGVLLISSYVIRTLVLLLGFYLVLGDQWQRLVACLLGLMIARHQFLSRIRAQATLDTEICEPSKLNGPNGHHT